jgi:hypothetical protein
MRSFPSYRFHPDGLMALIHCEDDHKSLEANGWQETLPANFVVPSAPHFYKIDEIPTTHKVATEADAPHLKNVEEPELGWVAQPGEGSEEESDYAEEDKGREMIINPEVQAAEDAVKSIPRIKRKTMDADEKRRIRGERRAAQNKRTIIKKLARKKETE